MRRTISMKICMLFVTLACCLIGFSANAATISWTDWTDSDLTNGFTGYGTISTETSTLDVTYYNQRGVGFYQASGGSDYWTDRSRVRDEETSPYTSEFVENIPTNTDIIALRYAGVQSLSFSEAIANPVFSFVSLNGNGYSFDQDFEILSTGGGDNACGYWGCGTSYKNVVDLGNGQFEYQLLGTGEPHGTIRFTGVFDTVTWTSLSNEYWNGFTVGVEGTAEEIYPEDPNPTPAPVPEPSTILLIGTGLIGLGWYGKKRS